MLEIIIAVGILLGIFMVFMGLLSWWIGYRVKSQEASWVFFKRQMILLPLLSILMVLYLLAKGKWFPNVSIVIEVIILLVLSLLISARVESYFANFPREFRYGDLALVITSVRNAFRFSEIKKIKVEQNSRINLQTVNNKGRSRVLSIHVKDSKERKRLVKWIREGMKNPDFIDKSVRN